MKVGFTGTRAGMSSSQEDQLGLILAITFVGGSSDRGRPEFHHGTHESVELKADARAAILAAQYGFTVVPHHAKRGEELQRDRKQVAEVDILIAAPLTDKEVIRSGTWTTIRYARKDGKPVVMLSRGTP